MKILRTIVNKKKNLMKMNMEVVQAPMKIQISKRKTSCSLLI